MLYKPLDMTSKENRKQTTKLFFQAISTTFTSGFVKNRENRSPAPALKADDSRQGTSFAGNRPCPNNLHETSSVTFWSRSILQCFLSKKGVNSLGAWFVVCVPSCCISNLALMMFVHTLITLARLLSSLLVF